MIEAKNLQSYVKDWQKQLTESIHHELKELYMEKTVFEVNFHQTAETYDLKLSKTNGLDQVEFYISTNPGEPLKPLSKIASGGELSRIMLALKSIFSKHQGVTSIIFDEVDTGVSGRVAQAIAEKIYKVSIDSQVLMYYSFTSSCCNGRYSSIYCKRNERWTNENNCQNP